MKKWESALVTADLPLSEAIRVLDREALRIVLVTDQERRLLGTVTDGDVRRALLNGKALTVPVREVMNSSPCTAGADWSKARMLATMERKQILQLPVLDSQGVVIGLETLHGILQRPRQANPVFLMAGGFGSRLRPLTHTCPKPLLKVGDKPILELILESFVNSGFHRFFISTHYMPEMIREHFGDGSRWNVSIEYVHEEEPLGTGGALGLLPHDEIDRPLVMMNGDILTNLNHLNLLAFHEEQGGIATVCVREFEQQVPFGVIEADGRRLTGITEKPVHKYNVNAGIYLLAPELVREVPPGKAIDMPTLLKEQVAEGRRVNIFSIDEYWLDIGRLEDLQRAQSAVEELFDAP